MKLEDIKVKQEPIIGTTCMSCDFTKNQPAVKVSEDELNKNGGMLSTNKDDLAGAKKADLITMPGEKSASIKKMCQHPEVKQWVTVRQCCNFWNAPGILTQYKEDKNEK